MIVFYSVLFIVRVFDEEHVSISKNVLDDVENIKSKLF